MNRYPVWKYAIIVVALLVGILYTLPNFFGEAPAVQVSSAKATVKIDAAVQQRVQDALNAAGVQPDMIGLEGTSVRARFDTPDTQLKAKDAIQKALVPNPDEAQYIVALNLVSRSPAWLTAIHAAPMYLGLDLRGGVHFMLQVDMQAALTKKAESYAGDIRSALRDKNIRHGGINREGQTIEVRMRDAATQTAARNLIADQFPDLQTVASADGSEFKLRATIKPEATRRVQEQALGRRGAAHQPDHWFGHVAGEHAVCAGRAEHWPAPTRYAAHQPGHAAPERRGQHPGGGGARPGRDAGR